MRPKPPDYSGHLPHTKGEGLSPGHWGLAPGRRAEVQGLPVQCSLAVQPHGLTQSRAHRLQALAGKVAGRVLTPVTRVSCRLHLCSRTMSASSPRRPSPPTMKTVTSRRLRRSVAATLEGLLAPSAPSPQGWPPPSSTPETRYGPGTAMLRHFLQAVPGRHWVHPILGKTGAKAEGVGGAGTEPRLQAPAGSFSHIMVGAGS